VQIARRRVDGPAHCRRPPAHRGGAEAALGGLSSVEARGDFDGVTDPKEVLKRFEEFRASCAAPHGTTL
jgi:hypothetical protein